MNVGNNTKLPTSRRKCKSYIQQFKEDYGRTPRKNELRPFVKAVIEQQRYGIPSPFVRIVF